MEGKKRRKKKTVEKHLLQRFAVSCRPCRLIKCFAFIHAPFVAQAVEWICSVDTLELATHTQARLPPSNPSTYNSLHFSSGDKRTDGNSYSTQHTRRDAIRWNDTITSDTRTEVHRQITLGFNLVGYGI